MMAAFMSTHDSYFICWASVIVNDVLEPLRKTVFTDGQKIRTTRICVIIIGIFLLIWGIWFKLPESVWSYMAITGTVYLSGSATILIGGMYWKRASTIGAKIALVCGLFSLSGLFIEQLQAVFPWLTMSVMGLGNYIFCGAVFIIFSLVFPDREKSVAGGGR
jgi:SSS family solute:Na+ symporter